MRKLAAALAAWGPGGVFLLAALDSAGVPLPATVDALLTLTALADPRSAYIAAACAVAGSALGSMGLFFLARKGGELYLKRHTESPRTKRFHDWFRQYGLVTVFIPKFLPIPLPTKVFVICAGALGVRPAHFLVAVLVARIPRYFALAYLGARLGDGTGAWMRAHAWHLGGAAAVLTLLLIALAWWAGRRGPAA